MYCTLGLEDLMLLNGHTPQGNLQIQCSSYKITNDSFTEPE